MSLPPGLLLLFWAVIFLVAPLRPKILFWYILVSWELVGMSLSSLSYSLPACSMALHFLVGCGPCAFHSPAPYSSVALRAHLVPVCAGTPGALPPLQSPPPRCSPRQPHSPFLDGFPSSSFLAQLVADRASAFSAACSSPELPMADLDLPPCSLASVGYRQAADEVERLASPLTRGRGLTASLGNSPNWSGPTPTSNPPFMRCARESTPALTLSFSVCPMPTWWCVCL